MFRLNRQDSAQLYDDLDSKKKLKSMPLFEQKIATNSKYNKNLLLKKPKKSQLRKELAFKPKFRPNA